MVIVVGAAGRGVDYGLDIDDGTFDPPFRRQLSISDVSVDSCGLIKIQNYMYKV